MDSSCETHLTFFEANQPPPYSPQLNLMKGYWRWLKEAVINNGFFPNVKK